MDDETGNISATNGFRWDVVKIYWECSWDLCVFFFIFYFMNHDHSYMIWSCEMLEIMENPKFTRFQWDN